MTKNEAIELAIALIQLHLDDYLKQCKTIPDGIEVQEWMIKQHKDAIAIQEGLKDG